MSKAGKKTFIEQEATGGASPDSRSAADDDAAHSVGEAVREEAGHVVVHDLHLAALELLHLVQAHLVLLGVLRKEEESLRGRRPK